MKALPQKLLIYQIAHPRLNLQEALLGQPYPPDALSNRSSQ